MKATLDIQYAKQSHLIFFQIINDIYTLRNKVTRSIRFLISPSVVQSVSQSVSQLVLFFWKRNSS